MRLMDHGIGVAARWHRYSSLSRTHPILRTTAANAAAVTPYTRATCRGAGGNSWPASTRFSADESMPSRSEHRRQPHLGREFGCPRPGLQAFPVASLTPTRGVSRARDRPARSRASRRA